MKESQLVEQPPIPSQIAVGPSAEISKYDFDSLIIKEQDFSE